MTDLVWIPTRSDLATVEVTNDQSKGAWYSVAHRLEMWVECFSKLFYVTTQGTATGPLHGADACQAAYDTLSDVT